MLDYVVLGAVQGLAEWLPVSSEGMLVLVQTYFLHSDDSLITMIETALFLHLGTVLAAIIYFRSDIIRYCKVLFSWKSAATVDRNVIIFLASTTIISGGIGLTLLQLLRSFEDVVTLSGPIIIFCIGVLLLVTGILQFLKPVVSRRTTINLGLADGIFLGIVQGFSALPGLSRSGLTIAALLFRNYEKETALRLSFLMSIPIVIGGNIVLGITDVLFRPEFLAGLLTAGIVGFFTIKLFMELARTIQFGYFVIGFGILMMVAAFV